MQPPQRTTQRVGKKSAKYSHKDVTLWASSPAAKKTPVQPPKGTISSTAKNFAKHAPGSATPRTSSSRAQLEPTLPHRGNRPRATKSAKVAENYKHSDATSLMRPEIGSQTRFKKKLPAQKYRYDDSLAPMMEWDGQNAARDRGEWLLGLIEEASVLQAPHQFVPVRELRGSKGDVVAAVTGLRDAVAQLKAMGKPFLNWAGKAERTNFDVPSLPLFIHERLSTKAILETLKGHKRDKQTSMSELFGDPQHSLTEQTLRAYEYQDEWVNRMMLGDSLVVMNSLLRFEKMGGQVQMIYMDPPYGVKYGSNFQPFVRRRDVESKDDDMTREPETVQAYRDTWELGLHSYLTYMRDRLLVARELLSPTGSVFVQISDDNIHHVRELMDEIFGNENFSTIISFAKTTSTTGDGLSTVNDYVLWYFKDVDRTPTAKKLYKLKRAGAVGATGYNKVLLADGSIKPLSNYEDDSLPRGAKVCTVGDLTAQKPPGRFPVKFAGKTWELRKGYWKTGEAGMRRLVALGRVHAGNKNLGYIRLLDDFPCFELNNLWTDTVGQNQFGPAGKVYAVQTANLVIQRCMLMVTQPGDLVFDPTCGSGTTAYVAEQWGRRWITCDTSRVPLALARQRLLTGAFPWFRLMDEARGPIAGFCYKRVINKKGEDVGGIVPHVTLDTLANEEPPMQETLVDRPEIDSTITRVTGPFCLEATIPTPMAWEGDDLDVQGVDAANRGTFNQRMIEVLRCAPVLYLGGNRTLKLRNVRPPTKTLSLSAEGLVDARTEGYAATFADAGRGVEERSELTLPPTLRPVAFVFGPENGAVSIRLVEEGAREAYQKSYTHLYVIGFAIQPNAREAIEVCEQVSGISATYVQATPDVMMGDLLKNLRSSQIFSVCGLPEISIGNAKQRKCGTDNMKYVELLGLDVFDPTTMEVDHLRGDDVPAWFLDTDYNGMCFHVSQAFFPRTSEWNKLKSALKGEFDDSVWEYLAGTVSAPFLPGDHQRIAVKVIDNRGNELLVVRSLKEANS
jgi:adenine-specific DNA-methyltransferase